MYDFYRWFKIWNMNSIGKATHYVSFILFKNEDDCTFIGTNLERNLFLGEASFGFLIKSNQVHKNKKNLQIYTFPGHVLMLKKMWNSLQLLLLQYVQFSYSQLKVNTSLLHCS